MDNNINAKVLAKYSILDEYDLTEIIKQCKNYQLEWFRMKLESIYPELEDTLDYLSNEDLVAYLKSRYNLEFETIITFYFKEKR